MDPLSELTTRLRPAADLDPDPTWVLVVLGVALLVAGTPPLWRILRLAVTLVHELGHALVGMAVGRRFTGFVLRGDASGHAVTVGPARGAGRVATTWAGYPAPGLVGAAMVWLALAGWSAAVIGAALLVLVVALIRVRSALTLLVMVLAVVGSASLWWWRDDLWQSRLVLGVGLVLLVGAWRHLAAVVRSRDRGSDPAVLAALTWLPLSVWNATFVAALAASTWVGALALGSALGQ